MIVSVETRRASILPDEPTATFGVERVIAESLPRESSQSGLRPVRASVEILRHGGGMMPRALLGGSFTPYDDAVLLIEVQTSGENLGGNRSCSSQLSKALVPGLPDEFAQAVVDGVVRRALPSGKIVVDRSAFDPVESSAFAFELAAELLAIVLDAMSMDRNVEHATHDAIADWP